MKSVLSRCAKAVVGIALAVTAATTIPYEFKNTANGILALATLGYLVLLASLKSVEPWLTFGFLLVGTGAHAIVVARTEMTYDPTMIGVLLAWTVCAFQVLAWSGKVPEAVWKGTDYMWVGVGVFALLGAGLYKVRAEFVKHPEEAYQTRMSAGREYVAAEIQRGIERPYVDPPPTIVGRTTVRIPPEALEKLRVLDAEYKRWLEGVRDELARQPLTWTAADLDRFVNTEPEEAGRSLRASSVAIKALARNFAEKERSKEWFFAAKEMTGRELWWLRFSPIGLVLVIGLRLGKTSAEVRKLCI